MSSSSVSIATWRMLSPYSSAEPTTSVSVPVLCCNAVNCTTTVGLFVCLDTIQRAMCAAFAVLVGSECRLWMKSSDSSCERLRNMHMSVLDACLSTGMVRTSLTVPHHLSR